MTEYFSKIPEVKFEGEESTNPFAFKFYDESKKVLGKSMKEHLRFATCYWHTFTWPGLDPFGGQTFDRPWMKSGDAMQMAKMKLDAAFDFFSKILTPFYCFHDRDVAPEGETIAESEKNLDAVAEVLAEEQQRTGKNT